MTVMEHMETITQNDPAILMQVEVKDSVRRHLKAEAAKAGKTMGDVFTDLLRVYGGYVPPTASGDSGGSENSRPSARPASKQR